MHVNVATTRSDRTFAQWLADHAVDVVFVVFVVATFVYSVRITKGSFFFADEWRILGRVGSVGRMFDEYNDSLSVVTMVLDRVLVEAFGMTYTPFRVVGLAALYLVPLTYFFTTRSRFGAIVAALLSFPLLWYGQFVSLMASEHNHNVALVGGIIAAAALNRGRRADGTLAAGLLLSLCSAGGGVAVAAACLTHNACTRAPRRRWLAVLGPILAWCAWWVLAVGHAKHLGPLALTTSQTATFVRRLAFTPFVNAGLGFQWSAYVLLVAFLAAGLWALVQGLDAAANFLAWSVATVVWGVGLANSRGVLADLHVFRYRYGALVFVLLAIVPRRAIRWPARFPLATGRTVSVVGALLILVLGGARGLAVRSDLQSSARQLASIGDTIHARVAMIRLGPRIVPDDVRAGTGIDPRSGLHAGQVRRLYAKYGGGLEPRPTAVDRELATLEASQRIVTDDRSACAPVSEPLLLVYRPGAGFGSVTLAARNGAVEIGVRRFGRAWVPMRTLDSGGAVRISPAAVGGMAAAVPWQIRASGSCRLGAEVP